MARRHAGRPRHDAARKPCGRLARSESPEPALALDQRAAAVLHRMPMLAGIDRRLARAKEEGDDAAVKRLTEERRLALQKIRRVARDDRLATPLGLARAIGLIDEPQYQAALNYERLHQIYYGGMPGRPEPMPSSHLASLVEDGVPALSGIADDDRATMLRRTGATLREAVAYMVDGDWRLVEDVVIYQRAPAFLRLPDVDRPPQNGEDAGRLGDAVHQLQNFRRSLNALCRVFRIPRRDTERMGEGP